MNGLRKKSRFVFYKHGEPARAYANTIKGEKKTSPDLLAFYKIHKGTFIIVAVRADMCAREGQACNNNRPRMAADRCHGILLLWIVVYRNSV